MTEFEKFIDELDRDDKKHVTANKVGNALFYMSLDPNAEANLAIQMHLTEQKDIDLKQK